MGIVHVLEQHREELPEWLTQPMTRFDRRSFFQSRTVYYPGSGIDGHPVSLCGRAHAAHAFVYVDNSTTQQAISDRVNGRDGIPFHDGYTVEYEQELEEADLWPGGVPEQHGDWVGWRRHVVEITPYVLFVVLKRKDGCDNTHGPIRHTICSLATTALRDTTLFIVRMMGRHRHSSWSLSVFGELSLVPADPSRELLGNAMCFRNGHWLGTPNLGAVTTIQEPNRSVVA